MIVGEKVVLRALGKGDLDKIWAWRNVLENKVITCSHPFPITHELEESWFQDVLNTKNRDRVYFAICDRASQELLGYIFLGDIDWINRHCMWGALIGDRINQGRGFGREAVLLAIRYAFEQLNMNKIYAFVRSDHPALATWQNNGAIQEGLLASHIWSGNRYIDMCIIAWHRKIQHPAQ